MLTTATATVLSPWTLFGWVLTLALSSTMATIGILTLGYGLEFMRSSLWYKVSHWATRNTLPEKGQVWYRLPRFGRDYYPIEILDITESGDVIHTEHEDGWADSPAEWRWRVKTFQMYLAE